MTTKLDPEQPRESESAHQSAMEIFRQPHFSPYKVYLRRDLKLAVFLNPKVGSSAFRKFLVEGLKNLEAKPQLGRFWPISEKRRYTTAPIGDFLHAFRNRSEYEFHCFVRNPYARVLSAWNDKLVKGFHAPQYPRSMIKLVPKIRQFAAERGLPGADDSQPVPFSSFFSFVESQPEGKRNQHWDTQTSVLLARKIPYTHIHQMEDDFDGAMADIFERVGIDREWTLQKFQRPVNASGKIKEPVLDSATAHRVYQLYAEDFQRFGYDQDSWQGL